MISIKLIYLFKKKNLSAQLHMQKKTNKITEFFDLWIFLSIEAF